MKSCYTLLFLLCAATTLAQKSGEVRCPRFSRTEKYYQAEHRHYTQVSLGYSVSRMWRNAARPTGDHFSFTSRPNPVIGISHHRILTDRFEVFAGLELSNTKQGLKFTYNEGGKIEEKKYSGSFVFRIPVGVTWNPAPRWSWSLAPYVTYTSLWEHHYTGSYSFRNANNIQAFNYQWNDLETYDKWFFGASVQTRAQLRKRLYGHLSYHMDFGASAPANGEIRISRTDNLENEYRGQTRPWLMHFGAGLSYRIFERYGEE